MGYVNDPIRPELRRITPYNSGLTLGEVRQKYHVNTIAKLGSNENPLGPTVKIFDIANELADLSRLYPDPQGRQLCARLAVMHGVKPEQIIGKEDIKVSLPYWGGKSLSGFEYVNNYLLPNFYFHVTTAYAIMRKNGVDLGKSDFMGELNLQ